MSSGKIGGKIVLEGASKYNSDLKSIKSNLTELRSEMRLATTQYSTSANSVEALTKKQEIYGKEIEQVTKKVDTYADMIKAAGKAQDSAAKQIDKYTEELADAKKKQDEMEKSGDATNEELEEQKKIVQELTGKLEGANTAYEAAGKKIQQYQTAENNAKAELTQLNQELEKNDKYLDEAQNSADGCAKSIDEYGNEVDEAGEKTSRFGDIVKGSLAADAIKAGLKVLVDGIREAATAAIDVGSSFEAGMDKVAAISGATGEELKALTDKAKEMGATTMFSAAQSADAFSYMAMAGWDAKAMLDGIEPVMSLAAASGSDLATVSDILTDDLTAFGLSAQDAGRFADVLAAASANANTNVELLGETFKYAAPVAGALGYSLEDVSVAAGLMANSGIKASAAGTALRSIMTRMAKPTKDSAKAMEDLGISLTDSEGNMYTFMEIMEQMRDSFSGLTDSEKAQEAAMLAGKNAMSGLLAVVNSSDEDFEKLCAAIDASEGAAKRMADTMQDNLKGKITILQSALEGLGIEIYDVFDDDLKDTVDGATDAVDRLSDAVKNGDLGVSLERMSDALGDFLEKAIDVGEDALPVLIDGLTWLLQNGEMIAGAIGGIMAAQVIMGAVEAWNAFRVATEGATVAQWLLNAAMEANPVGIILMAVGALAGAIGAYALTAENAADVTDEWAEKAKAVKESTDRLIESHAEEISKLEKARDTIKELSSEESLNEEQKARMRVAVEELNGSIDGLNLMIDEETGFIKGDTDAILDNVDAMLERYKMVQKQEELDQIIKDIAETEKLLADAENELNEARKTANEEQEQLNGTLGNFLLQIAAGPDAMRPYIDASNEASETVTAMEENVASINQTLEEQRAQATALAEDVQSASESIEESTAEVAEQYTSISDVVEGATGTLSEFWAVLSEEEQKALEELMTKVQEFDGLFDQIKTTSDTSSEQIIENLANNSDAMNNYADDIHAAMEIANNAEGETGESVRGIVNHLISLGLDGAAELHLFVEEAQKNSDEYQQIIENFGNFEEAKEKAVQAIADWNLGMNEGWQEMKDTALQTHEELATEQTRYQDEAIASAEQFKDDYGQMATDIQTTYADNTKNEQDNVASAQEDVSQAVVDAAEDTLGISGSYSSVFADIAHAVTGTLADEIRSGSGEVAAAVHELCEEACASFDLSPLVDRIEGLIADGVSRAEAAIGAIMG